MAKHEHSYPEFPGFTGTRSTSFKAAENIAPKRSRLQAIILDAIKERPRTSQELEIDLGMDGGTIRPRIRELVLHDLVADSGLRRETKFGRKSIVWQAYRD